MKKVELLAPAKDKETAIAAINFGADAVYIGASDFGARRAVPNSLDDIKDVVNYAHKFYAKVHVTINTILTENELEDAEKLIHRLYEIGVDAIIVQDMGILQLAVEGKLPPIAIHASTQCDNRSLEKVKFFENAGVSRVILARETSLEEIKEICSGVNCEIETFIHGALCVSYSGQCYLSYAIGGRSANRGECAQPCRKKYSLVDDKGNIIAKDKYLLNLRDFNASKHIEELINAGVKSFKIEGRLKDINYVKNVVAFYRREIDKYAGKISSGKTEPDFEPDVNKSFNRGFTDYLLDKRKNCYNFSSPKSLGEKLGKVTKNGKNYFEIDCSGLCAQDGLCWFENDEMKGCLINKTEGSKIFPNKLVIPKTGTIIYRNQDTAFEKKLKNSKTKRQIRADFKFESNILTASDEDGNKISIPLNYNEKPNNPEKMKENFINGLSKTGGSDFYIGNIVIKDDLPFVPVSHINEIRREILDSLMSERLKNYKRETQNPLHYTDFPQKELDYRANIHNYNAKEFYKNSGCTINEMSMESQNSCKGKCLMQTKHCLKFAFGMCKSHKAKSGAASNRKAFPAKLFLIDEKGKKYRLEFDCKNCMMQIWS